MPLLGRRQGVLSTPSALHFQSASKHTSDLKAKKKKEEKAAQHFDRFTKSFFVLTLHFLVKK